VLKPGGLLLLNPAWNCSDLAANGYAVRPYSDFSLAGKAIKASIPIQRAPLFQAAYTLPIRAARLAAASLSRGPTAFHYRPIAPNYGHYWVNDGDAVNSMDFFEAYLWFKSRGDECLNCPPAGDLIRLNEMAMILRVKPGAAR